MFTFEQNFPYYTSFTLFSTTQKMSSKSCELIKIVTNNHERARDRSRRRRRTQTMRTSLSSSSREAFDGDNNRDLEPGDAEKRVDMNSRGKSIYSQLSVSYEANERDATTERSRFWTDLSSAWRVLLLRHCFDWYLSVNRSELIMYEGAREF